LLVNAIEALGSGGRVQVHLSDQDRFLQISIQDDGPGIPAPLQKKIFEPFFTTKSQGTGLGLAIVARRVSEMGGEIHWRTPVNNARGTQFVVKLPIADPLAKTDGEKGASDENCADSGR
jgi:signal transduction histidine kinase